MPRACPTRHPVSLMYDVCMSHFSPKNIDIATLTFRKFTRDINMCFMRVTQMTSYRKLLKSVGEPGDPQHLYVKAMPSIPKSTLDSMHSCNVSASVLAVSETDLKDTVLCFCLKWLTQYKLLLKSTFLQRRLNTDHRTKEDQLSEFLSNQSRLILAGVFFLLNSTV